MLDELTTGLDPAARRDTWAMVQSLKERGVTVVLVTHAMDEAEILCDRLVLINFGRIMAERERLARELHDTIAQGFTSVVMQLESAEQALTERPVDAREHLEKARRIARENLGEVRRTVSALRPELLEGSSLNRAATRAVGEWSEAAGIAAETRITGDVVTLPGRQK